jgi:hypothetical protein
MPIRRIHPDPEPAMPEDKLEDLLDRFEELLNRMEKKIQVDDKDTEGDV